MTLYEGAALAKVRESLAVAQAEQHRLRSAARSDTLDCR